MEKSQAQGRFYVLDNPVSAPGQCAVCGYGGTDRKYLDPQLHFEFYGAAIFCRTCVNSMASMFGFIEPAQALVLETKVEEAERELIKLRAALAAMEDLSVAFASLGFGTDSGVIVSTGVADSIIPTADSDAAIDVAGSGLGDSETDLSDLFEGPDDVRNSASNNTYNFDL